MIIPTLFDGTAYYSQRTTLEGVDYLLEFRWGVREARWFLNLYDSLGASLILGMKLQTGWPLLRYYHGRDGVPTGELMVVTLGTSDEPPGLTEMGIDQRCQLQYLTLEDLTS